MELLATLPKMPLAADLAAMKTCLRLLGERPLKLVAEAVRPDLQETEWSQPAWTYGLDANRLTGKDLLALPQDTFQFSIADERSKQDFHSHAKVLEIYASETRLEIVYLKDGQEHGLAVEGGVLIVPPGVPHQVRLKGLTFVFQVGLEGGQVHGDKLVIDRKPETLGNLNNK